MDKPVEAWDLRIALDARIRSLKSKDLATTDAASQRGFRSVKWGLFGASALLLFALISHGIPYLTKGGVAEVSLLLACFLLWRVVWTLLIAWRARRYRANAWADLRRRADLIWSDGWRPKRLHIQVTACFDSPEITEGAICELVSQLRSENIPATIYYGTTSAYDEAILKTIFDDAIGAETELDLDLVFIRLQQAGHYVSKGKVLREIRRWGAAADDLIIFLDDDTVLGPNLLKKTLPLFGVEPDLQIVATDQHPVCFGPRWIETWLNLRFAQRRLELCAQALSGRFLPFSGRIRILRARQVLDEGFIRAQEVNQRGLERASRFRRLSVADSITWCHLLQHPGKMIFAPDAQVYSISLLQDASWVRIARHLRRWSGKIMRRALQVIMMGPLNVPLFVWLRVVDMRFSALLALIAPCALLAGEMMLAGFAGFWIILICLIRVLTGGLLLQAERPLWILLPYIGCVTPLIHAGVIAADWVSRLSQNITAHTQPRQAAMKEQEAWAERSNIGVSSSPESFDQRD